MYRGEPAIDRAGGGGGSRSAGDTRRARSPRRRRASAAADLPEDADGEEESYAEEEEEDEEAYVVLDVLPRRSYGDSTARVCCNDDSRCCRAAQKRPGRRRRGSGNMLRILYVAAAAAFLALAVSPVSGTTNKKEEETTVPSITKGTTVVLGTRTRTGSDPGGSIDLLAALQLRNTTRQGVIEQMDTVTRKSAFYLQGDERELRLNEENFERAAALLRRVPEFTIAVMLLQNEASTGTIVAFSHGNYRYLELQSSGRKDELRLHYVSRRDGTVHVETFPFRLADGAWHKVALSISGSQVELLIDCHPLYRRLLKPGPPDTNFTLPQLQLWVGQRNAKHFFLKGALKEAKLIAGPHGYLSQCPTLDSSCPTCGQFSMLQNEMEDLIHNINDLYRRLAAAEGRISKVEECECQKSCRVNGTIHEDGAIWMKDNCQKCSCVHGKIECNQVYCAKPACKNPVVPEGKCCPICLRQCFLDGILYDHGEKTLPKHCYECVCNDGIFTCLRINNLTECPPLSCPPNEQISVADECCKVCRGVDYCLKGHKCHVNATCRTLETKYACQCNKGFKGDNGLKCDDVDECEQQGGENGHFCNSNTICVNVIGSYTCKCLPGYYRVDAFNCAELDECANKTHLCHENATCSNTIGSYKCNCKDGYSGNGFTCKPVCNGTCQNGGVCVAPGRCDCRRGYTGNNCEFDLDECTSDLHRCHNTSKCFNMPGWYYCRCKDGYKSALHESTGGTQCVDVDECKNEAPERPHTCHPTAKCVNTEGGYECVCPPTEEESGKCSLDCWFENREVKNGDILAPLEDSCRTCTCQNGVITCEDRVCDCSVPDSRSDKCCPQCNPDSACRHQELHSLVFRSGERWIYQCQTCECLYGEIDCWQMECPPVTCSNPVTEEGDCCPRCEDDPCAREVPMNGTSYSVPSRPRPCSYSGIVHDSGSSWQAPHDKCTTCECKDGQLCCSYDYGCAGDLGGDKQQHSPTAVPELLVHHPSDPTVQSMVNSAQEAALPAVIGTSGTTRIINPAIINSVASTTSPDSSPSRYSASSINYDNPHDLRQGHATGSHISHAQQRDTAYHTIGSQQQQHQQQTSSTTRHQRFVRGSTTLSTASERSATPSTTTTRTPSAMPIVRLRSRRSPWSNTVNLHRRGTAFSSSSLSSSPTLAMVLATIEEPNPSATRVSAQIRAKPSVVGRRYKNSKKSTVLDSAT